MNTPVVLVVDDDDDIRAHLRGALESEGYTVELAANGLEAFEYLTSSRRPSLILLDVKMPLMDGPNLIARLGSDAELASIAVVVMTATPAAAETNALPYPILRKPIARDALLEAVTAACPRLWDDELPTDQVAVVDELPPDAKATNRDRCVVCSVRATRRCVGCAETFCRGCLDAGPDGRCARCWRASSLRG